MYKQDGFLVVKNCFKREEILNIKKQFTDCFTQLTNKNNCNDIDIINFFKDDFEHYIKWASLCQNLVSLYTLASKPSLIKTLKECGLKLPCFNTKPTLLFSCEKTAKHQCNWKIPSHQDYPSMRGSLNSVTVWTPFVDIDDTIGPLEISRGSHMSGLLPFCEYGNGLVLKQDENFEFEKLYLNIGDIVVFNCFTVHKSGVNHSKDRIRISAQFRFDDALEQSFVSRGYPKHKKEIRIDTEYDGSFPTIEQVKNIFI